MQLVWRTIHQVVHHVLLDIYSTQIESVLLISHVMQHKHARIAHLNMFLVTLNVFRVYNHHNAQGAVLLTLVNVQAASLDTILT